MFLIPEGCLYYDPLQTPAGDLQRMTIGTLAGDLTDTQVRVVTVLAKPSINSLLGVVTEYNTVSLYQQMSKSGASWRNRLD